jgi:iron(III) transport system ATP-binding protein
VDILTPLSKLTVRDLSKKMANKTILDSVDFDIYEREFVSILGPSGCGKTTILRILIGLTAPTTGVIYKDGVDITNTHPSKRGMGIVFQNYALFENMTVLENVEYAMRFRADLKKQARTIAENLVEQIGLKEHAYKRPGNLSGGQQQRVAIARTMALNPDIILFDEPMSALDVATRLTLRKEIKRIQKKFGTTIIYVTHDQEEAFAMSDRIIVMEEAKISQFDTPMNIVDKPANEYVKEFVLDNLETKIQSLARYVSESAVADEPTLDRSFMTKNKGV